MLHNQIRRNISALVKPAYAVPALLMLCLQVYAQTEISTPNALKLGWRVSCEGYSIRDRSLCEAMDALAAMGILNIEPVDNGVKLSKTDGTTVGYNMSSAKRSELKKYMADRGMKMPTYYVGYNKASMTDSKLWEFLKEMGVEVLGGEPETANLAAVEKLSKQFGIPLGIHNHPKGSSIYWHPDTAIALLHSKNMGSTFGFCPDIGHWARSNIDVLKGLSAFHKTRTIYILHVKDIRKTGTVDTVLGTGRVPCKEVLDSLYAWKWQGVITIELEANPPHLQDIEACAKFIEDYAKSKLTGSFSLHNALPDARKKNVTLFITPLKAQSVHTKNTAQGATFMLSGREVGKPGSFSPMWKKTPGVYISREVFGN